MDDHGGSTTIKRTLPIVLVLVLFSNGWADFSGQAVGVLDGDTIEVLHRGKAERIRLNGIDCPEKCQAYSKKAKHAASDLAFGKEVIVQTYGHDKYKRTIGDVILPDGMNLNQELVKQGWCWWCWKYAPGDTMVEGLGRKPGNKERLMARFIARCTVGMAKREGVTTGSGRRNIMDATLHDIVNGAMIVRVHAERMRRTAPTGQVVQQHIVQLFYSVRESAVSKLHSTRDTRP